MKSNKNKPFIIAEMSGNHNQSLERALNIVEKAAESGVSAIKLQTLNPETITLDVTGGDFLINDNKSLWDGNNLIDLYKIAQTPWEWHKPLIDKANEMGIMCFSTPFDESAVDFLENLNVPAYKIASFENAHLPLIKKVAETKKLIILSTGMATISELDKAVSTIRDTGNNEIVLLKCTSSYPAPPDNCNLLTIPHMKDLFKCEIGLSDHTLGIGVAVAAVALGATFIEKHFTLNRSDGGVDADFSIEPDEMKQLVIEANSAWQARGQITYGKTTLEQNSVIFRRSLYIAEHIKKGDTLTDKNLKIVRPGLGLHPENYHHLIGKKVNRDLQKGTRVSWDIIG